MPVHADLAGWLSVGHAVAVPMMMMTPVSEQPLTVLVGDVVPVADAVKLLVVPAGSPHGVNRFGPSSLVWTTKVL